MGKQRRLRKLKRMLRGTQRVMVDLSKCKADPGAWVAIDEAQSLTDAQLSYVVEHVPTRHAMTRSVEKHFRVGMSISGPPEMFGLPPDPGCGEHATGTPGCTACYPPREPVYVTAVDEERGVITLSSAPADQ